MTLFSFEFALIALFVTSPLAAQSDLSTQGIRTVQVEIRASFLDTASIRTTMELALRRVGIRVLAPGTHEPTDAWIEFFASSEGAPGDGNNYHAVFGRVSVWRRVYLRPTPDAPRVVAAVWQEDFPTSDKEDILKDSVRGELDKFLNEWFQANPRVARSSP